jgi:hypothetical protein
LNVLLSEVENGKRAGYTFTGLFRFDIDNQAEMDRVYDKLGHRAMFAIATTNRPASEFYMDHAVIGQVSGIALWRDDRGIVYADDVTLHLDIDDEEALRIARAQEQAVILKVDGRTRSFAFMEAPGWDVIIREEGKKRTFEQVREE